MATPTELPGELADVLEVFPAMAMSADLAWEKALQVQKAKRCERGGLVERLWLEGLA